MSSASKYITVGRVVAVHRYPVKSMTGEGLEAGRIGWHGVVGDRRFAFLRENDPSGLPWLSARETPGVLGYSASYATDEDVDRGRPLVVTPTGACLPVSSSELIGEMRQLSGQELRLVRLHRGAFDAMALSLISTSSIASTARLADRELDVRRFRPNILIESVDDHPFPEDRWVGDLLVFGESAESARMRVNRRDPRCQIVSIDPDTLAMDRAVFSTIVRERKNLCGVYGSTERAGTVHVGDVVLRRKH